MDTVNQQRIWSNLKMKHKIDGIAISLCPPAYVSAQEVLYPRGGGLGSRPQKMYGERLGDGVEYHLMKPTPRR